MSVNTAPQKRDRLVSLREKLLPTEYTPWVKTMAYAVVLANIFLIVSGGIVRLTGSGLGCDTWPRCTTEGSWTTTPEMGIHGIVEFGNRMLTFVLMAVTVLAFLSIVRIVLPHARGFKDVFPLLFTGLRSAQNRYSDIFNLSLLLLWGIPLQAIVGGISVWLKLNPWMITAHFYLTGIMIGIAAIYLNRVLRYFEKTSSASERVLEETLPAQSKEMRILGWIGLALVAYLVFMGTVVTGTGPHAGDPQAHRHAFNPVIVTRMHSLGVWAYCATVIFVLLLQRKNNWPVSLKKGITLVLLVLVYQAVVGYTQYFNGLPIWLVELHLLGSGLFIWAAVSLIEKQLVIGSASERQKTARRIYQAPVISR
ncbi:MULTISPECIES: COX15/CtaA family protein [Rothia]|uniref:COX15/CtaA family protein n=1 Tax=Rothia TaxID=32207 RepID=UPI000831806C|nr:COX15/CtaA family protein [Rothia sp. ND6WE1A]